MPEPKNGRVTIRDLYEAIEKQNEKLAEVERRIMTRLEILPALQTQSETNKSEIDRLRSRSDGIDVIVAFVSAAMAAISGWLGSR